MGLMRFSFLITILLSLACVHADDRKPVRPASSSPAGPYTPGILAGGTLYVSGQIGRDATGKIAESFEDEVKQCLENAGTVLKEAGYAFSDAVTVQVYLTDMTLFERMNKVYLTYFPEPRPARTTVGVAKLVGTARIEITVTAWKNTAGKTRKK